MLKCGHVIISMLVVFVLNAPIVNAQNDTAIIGDRYDSESRELFFIAGYQNLRSTHIDHFIGFNGMIAKNFTSKLSLGIGLENTYGQRHDDNGWKLSEIRLVPIFLNARYLIGKSRWFVPFVELSSGITFLKYYKKVKVPAGSPEITEVDGLYNFGQPFLMMEKGLYTYVGSGAYFRIHKHFVPYVGIGFKGYKMSMNRLDVNPRGLNFEVGCKF